MRVQATVCSLLLCGALPRTQQATFDELHAAFQRAAAANADAAVLEFLPRFEAAADSHHDTEAAVPFLGWIVRNGQLGAPVGKALDTLAQQHTKSLALGPVLEILPHLATYLGDGSCHTLLEGVLAAGSPPELQARALLARATMVMARTGDVDEALLAAAAKDLEQARKLTKDPALAATVARISTAARGLKVGDLAPEVAGFDLDGQPFRLSDYRGKVVVLDFWGDW